MNNWGLILTAPFFLRAIWGGVLVALLSSFLGTHVVMRRASFFGDAIAHSALTGVALALLLDLNPLAVTAVFTVLIALILPFVERQSRLPIDNLLGSLLPVAMAVGVILLAVRPGYQPDLLSYLFGNILTIGVANLWVLTVLTLVALVLLWLYRRQITLVSINRELAQTTGVKVIKMELLYNVLLALTVVASLQLVGVILVNALLIVPATTARLLARSFKSLTIITPILAVGSVLLGLLSSVILNLPSGPAIALVAGLFLLLGMVLNTYHTTHNT